MFEVESICKVTSLTNNITLSMIQSPKQLVEDTWDDIENILTNKVLDIDL